MQLYYSGEFRASSEWPYAITSGCVIYRKVKEKPEVLLLYRSTPDPDNNPGMKEGMYHLAKGHMQFDEGLKLAAEREAEEESGCRVDIKSYLGALHWNFLHPEQQVIVDKTSHYFVAECIDESGTMDQEHDEKIWVSLGEAEKLLGTPNPKGEDEIIRRLKKFLELTHA